jgi:hypothetical protein
VAGVYGGLGVRYFTNGIFAIGVFFGLVFFICLEFYADIFGKSIEPDAGFIGTILGAGIALGGTLLAIAISKEEAAEKLVREDQAIVAEVFIKYQAMINSLYTLRKHMRESYDNVTEESHANPGLFVLSLATHPPKVVFSTKEKALFLRLKLVDLFNDIAQWDEIYNSLIGAFEKYANLREQFMTDTPAAMEGNVGTTELSEEEFKRFAPKMAQLNFLAEQLRGRTETDYSECKVALERVAKTTRELCGIKLDFSVPE